MNIPRNVLGAITILTVFAEQSFAATVILPREGATLNYTHVQFRWEPVDFFFGGPGESYQLWVVEDNGNKDPFQGEPAVINYGHADSLTPRVVITEGLEFGKSYAWRVRGFAYDPLQWGPTHRFSIGELPEHVPAMTVTVPENAGPVQPGITLLGGMFSFAGNLPPGQVLIMAVDETGQPVWHRLVGFAFGNDVRMLENGRLLWIDGDQAMEATINGSVLWASPEPVQTDPKNHPDEYDNRVHHEAFPMPNGNVLAVTYTWQDVWRDDEWQRWRSDRIVEFDRKTNEIVWEWNEFDYLSTLDFDETTMLEPTGDGDYNWTHTNAAIYNEADNSVYLSCRHLNRIVCIDYDTKDINYMMGFTSPSGEVDFGDNLFSFQHSPQMLPNGNMIVYDNGNRRDHVDQTNETGVTKAIEIAFSGGERPTNASIVWEYTLPDYNSFVGDADRLSNGNTLVVSGVQGEVIEVDSAAQEVWRISTDDGGFPAWGIYRAERISSLIVDTPGDIDGDWDLDLIDFGGLQDCFTGPGPASLAFPCTLSDLDDDDDVDHDDLELFVDGTTGPAGD